MNKIYDTIIERSPIDRGWSGDRKYCVTTADGGKYLLRISPKDRFDRKKQEFEKMQAVAVLGIPMCFPIEFGLCEEGVYSLQSWIDGRDAEEEIANKAPEIQYEYGLSAGQILAKIHTIPAPTEAPPWEGRFHAKIDQKIAMYTSCDLKYECGGEPFLTYIAQNRHLLHNRPQCYQHGDYHIGNMMLDHENILTIIDFDRDDFGDPWEEFNRIVWCAQTAPAFASGMVDGYFGGAVPKEFWKLLALYICSNTLGSLPWAIPFGDGEIKIMQDQTKQILSWYDNMTQVIPQWYQSRWRTVQTFIQPAKWRETTDPFSLNYRTFQPTEILGYPHAGNDVFHAIGTAEGKNIRAYIKSARQKGADFANEVRILSQLHDPIYPRVLDYDEDHGSFSVTEEVPGLRLSVIVGENEALQSLSYMETYGEALSHIHKMHLSAENQKDRKFYHTPTEELLEQLDLSHLAPFFSNKPTGGKRVFCHGDCHYANILWQDRRISGILDFELSGYGDRDFDIAWAIFLRPGQKFMKTDREVNAFLRGYQKHGTCDISAVRYYMAQCYVYFMSFCKEEEDYCNYIRSWLNKHCT